MPENSELPQLIDPAGAVLWQETASIRQEAPMSVAGDDALWTVFTDAGSRSAYCQAWLALQCRAIASATAGMLLLEEDGSYIPAATWPAQQRDLAHLRDIAEKVLTQRTGVVLRLPVKEGTAPGKAEIGEVQIGYPVIVRDVLYGAAVIHARPGSDDELQSLLRQLHWGIGWLEALFWRMRARDDKARLDRAAVALDVLAVTQEQPTLAATTLACANELVGRLGCDRVAIGWKHRGGIELKAMSHQSKVERKAKFIDTLENAMDEAFDQNATVCHPPLASGVRRVGVGLRSFASENGFISAVSVIMPARDNSFGVITFMRLKGDAFDAETVLLAEAVAALVGPVLEQKVREHRWFSGRLVDAVADVFKAIFGRRHPTLKIAVIALIAGMTTLAMATGDFQVSGKSVVEGAVQRAAVAPIDGYIAESTVRAGDVVKAGEILAVLDDKDLKLDLLKWQTEKDKALQKMREASAEHDRASIATYSAQAKQADAQYGLAEEMLARTRITAPIDGFVVSGDLSQTLGAPTERGKVLFEIAPLSSYRVILQVGESDIRYISLGQQGRLTVTGLPDAALSVTVSKITSIATVDEGRNYFRVEATVGKGAEMLRPGMEGIAKLHVEERKLLWIWTRGLTDWVKLTWWAWRPL